MNKIPFGSPAHKRSLEASYGMTTELATAIVKNYEENPTAGAYRVYRKATSLLNSLRTPVVTASLHAPIHTLKG